MFGKDSVYGHNQCITETEKYGPIGQSKPSNGTPAKPQNNSKQQPDFDINAGLSNRYPWFCSLCNTKATSQQTLLAHADGKEHRGKAKAFHAKQQSTVDATEKVSNGDSEEKKKRKLETLDETSIGDVLQGEESNGGEVKKAKKQDDEKKINWKNTAILERNKSPNRLVVDEAFNDGSSVVSLHPATMEKLAIRFSSRTLCDESCEEPKIRMNKVVGSNLRVRLGDVISLHQCPDVKYGSPSYETGAFFFCINRPEIMSKLAGESNLRKAFKETEKMDHSMNTHGYVGADLAALCTEAALQCIREKMDVM
ncbi:unnamed protein product [Thlaspi arvense]|uniref:U1-type domain-containing protein n=1 Tax=Thlaspi arvense TaxID=13288 RepID=A0AAU9SWB1_THLAR|nr:unnamed protein product [Thlaspi arvense]